MTLAVQNRRNLSMNESEDDVHAIGSMATSLPLGSESNSSNTESSLQAGQFELCYYPSSFLLPSEVLPAFTASNRVLDAVILDSAQHPLSSGMSVSNYSAMMWSVVDSVVTGLDSALQQNGTQATPPTAAGALSSVGSVRSLLAQLSLNTTQQPTPATQRLLRELRLAPSPGLIELRRRALFWSSQTYPRRTDSWIFGWSRLEKRTQHRLQLARETVRALTALLGIDYADVVEDISIPFQDCASDQAHVDWPVVDQVFAAVYDALQRKLACNCSAAHTR